jgi:hypothetical protein
MLTNSHDALGFNKSRTARSKRDADVYELANHRLAKPARHICFKPSRKFRRKVEGGTSMKGREGTSLIAGVLGLLCRCILHTCIASAAGPLSQDTNHKYLLASNCSLTNSAAADLRYSTASTTADGSSGAPTAASPGTVISFVGRTQSTSDYENSDVRLELPSNVQDGDLLLVVIETWNSTPQPPEGWSSLGSTYNSSLEHVFGYSMAWHTGDPSAFSFGPANYPKGIMRVYRGAESVDASTAAPVTAGADTCATSFPLPALRATSAPNDLYVGFYANDDYVSAISGPPILLNRTVDQTQWASFDGDVTITRQGVKPLTRPATIATSGNWVGFALTLSVSASTPTPTPSVEPTPIGAAPPSGKHWALTFDDEFSQDSSIDSSKWNGGAGGGLQWCGNGQNIEGNQGCSENYSNEYIVPGVGVALQPVVSPPWTLETLGGVTASLNTGGPTATTAKFSQHYGYFEFSAKLPHDFSGEGDGLHPDIWALPIGKSSFSVFVSGDDEVDVAENDIGAGSLTNVHFSIFDGLAGDATSQAYPFGPDLSANFHTYGLYWINDGSAHGSFQAYFDGAPQTSPVQLTDGLWDNGVYLLLWMDPCVSNAFWGGAACTSNTSNSDPLLIQYARAWRSG